MAQDAIQNGSDSNNLTDAQGGDVMLDGAPAIAEELYGDRRKARRVHYLRSVGAPIAVIGNRMMVRRSTLWSWWSEREHEAAIRTNKPAPKPKKRNTRPRQRSGV